MACLAAPCRHTAPCTSNSTQVFKRRWTSCTHILRPRQHPGPKAHTKHLALEHFSLCRSQAERHVRLSLAWCFNASKGGSGEVGWLSLCRIWSVSRLVVSPGTWAYAVPTRSLREAYACSRVPWQESGETFGLSKSVIAGPYSNKQVECEEHQDSSRHGQLAV